ncbi:MAG: TolC family protein [Hyphomicrobiaceae bacterium]|nr:MAG: TolC family protein [Hyphomicrobiaceae bacterium]
MRSGRVAFCATIFLIAATPAFGQVGGPVTAPVARPAPPQTPAASVVGPPGAIGPRAPFVARTGPLPARLTVEAAVAEAAARAPAIVAAQAEVDAARARLGQARVRPNPELNVEVENLAGGGAEGIETTVSLNQRLDLGGRRRARVSAAEAALSAQELRLSIALADLARDVRTSFATALAANARLDLAQANQQRAAELARISEELVAAGREPPLRALRARTALAQSEAALRAAEAEQLAARQSLGVLLGGPVESTSLIDSEALSITAAVDPAETLEVRLAEAERVAAEAGVAQERAAARLDPSVGVGVRHIAETGDKALVAGFSVPLPLFDRNRGNIAAARAGVRAAEARREAALAQAAATIANARTALAAADARVRALETAAVPEAREALRLTELSYQAGRSSLLELLDAQEAFATVQSELIEARLARATAAATLTRSAAQ